MEENAKRERKMAEVYIDRKLHQSPDPTTGVALYLLGGVKPGYDLYEEEPGPVDDKLIPNNPTEIRLKNFAHFYSAQRDLNPGARSSVWKLLS
jgi:hypothetical protein